MFKLALIQMRVEGGAKEKNLRRARELALQAAAHGATVALLPETMTLGWTHPSAKTDADEIPGGQSCSRLRGLARETGLYLCAGLVERDGARIFNAAVLIDPHGEVILHHRKLNELEIGQDLYALGDRLQVARTNLGAIGIMICADAFAQGQVVSRALGYMGADLVLSPCAWAVPADHDNAKEPYGALWLENYGPVARDFQIWIAGVSNVGWITGGPWQGRKCIGCSLVVDPLGKPALEGPYGVEAETILYLDIHPRPRPAQGEGWKRMWSEQK